MEKGLEAFREEGMESTFDPADDSLDQAGDDFSESTFRLIIEPS